MDVLLRFCFLVSPALARLLSLLSGRVAPEYADVVLMVARDLAMVVERVQVPSSARSSWRCVVVRLLHIWVMYCTGLRLFSLCLFPQSCRVLVTGLFPGDANGLAGGLQSHCHWGSNPPPGADCPWSNTVE